MIGAAACLLGGAMLTSCSSDKDLYDGAKEAERNAENLLKDYAANFQKVFGEIAPDQTWGFGAPAGARATRAKGTYDGFKGNWEPVEWYQDTNDGWKWKTRTYVFPSDCDASRFLADVPSGVLSYTEVAGQNQTGYASGTSYLDPSWTNEVNIWGFYDGTKTVGGTLYIKGENDFSNRKFAVAQNTDVYLLEGATLKLNDEAASTIKFNLYIARTAKLIATGSTGRVKLDNGAQMYNHGTIDCKSFEVNNTSMLYNVGTLTTTGEVYVANSASVIVNDGEITSGTEANKTGKLVTAGSGRVQNNAEWTVYGETIINSNYNIWVNNGHFITENYTYTATSSSVINNCFLTVNNNFCMNISDGNGDFKISNGGGVLTNKFYGGGKFTAKDNNNNDITFNGGPFKVTMGANSVFKVTDTAYMNALGSGIATAHYGFEGVATGNEYAVLQAKAIVRESLGEGNVAYSGHLYVSAEEHFAQGYSGQYPYIHYYDGCAKENIYAAGFESGKPAITIPATVCNPGFDGGTPTPPTKPFLRVIAEDLTTKEKGDFDFNDIVFDVEYVSATQAKVTILAAGGTLPLTINGQEVHQLFIDANPNATTDQGGPVNTQTMINTNAQRINPTAPFSSAELTELPTLTLTGSWSDDQETFSAQVRDNIPLVVTKKNEDGTTYTLTLTAEKGKAPGKVGIASPYYEWKQEKVYIGDGFKKFVSDPTYAMWWKE